MLELRWVIRHVQAIENGIFALREVKVLQYREHLSGAIEPLYTSWADVPTAPEGSDG